MAKKHQFRAPAVPCVYCGAPSSTRDHVVPESLFHGHKYQLVTVRACLACNQKKKEFDTFLRDFLAVDVRTQPHQAAQYNFFGPFARATMRGQSELARQLKEKLEPVQWETPSGIIVWRGTSAVLENGEVDEAVSWIVRGLTYRYLKQRVSLGAVITVQLLTMENADYVWRAMAKMGSVTGPAALGDEVFRWAFQHADADHSIWLIAFYGRMYFLVVVRPPGSGPLKRASDDAATPLLQLPT